MTEKPDSGSDTNPESQDDASSLERSRRPRYRGTHPRRFDQRYKELQPDEFPEMQSHIRAQGRTPAGTHVPIMVNEVLEVLAPQAGEIAADATLGYAGHASEILQRVLPGGRLIGLDIDPIALEKASQRLTAVQGATDQSFVAIRSNFAGLAAAMNRLEIPGFDVVLADLGVSSMQIDDPRRGFSYKHDGPLDMRMDDRIQRNAADWLARLTFEELNAALRDLSDEPDHGIVAAAIVDRREEKPIRRTLELVDLIRHAKRRKPSGKRRYHAPQPHEIEEPASDLHPAALTFQTLRILVNDEMASLRHLLRTLPDCLAPGGRAAILSFHSGEDRLVKHAFRDGVKIGDYADTCEKPLRAGPAERRDNPRSAAARLRWVVRAHSTDQIT